MRGVQANGAQVAILRRAQGMTQEELAALASIDVTTLRRMENGHRRVDVRTVAAVSEALGINLTEIITPGTVDVDRRAEHIECIYRWHAAFLASAVETLLLLHTEDSILEIVGADGLPAAGSFVGIDAVREHLLELFQLFKVRSVQDDDFQIHAVDSLVFLRTTATIEYLPKRVTYTTRHVNEFEMRDGLIARRTVVADYSQLRQIVE